MAINPSLTSRLRLGFAILFALLLAVSLLGVGRLFQIRVDFEDETALLYEAELENAGVRTSFALQQAAIRPPARGADPSADQLKAAAAGSISSADRITDIAAGEPEILQQLKRLRSAERSWTQKVAAPLIAGKAVPAEQRAALTQAVFTNSDALAATARDSRDRIRDRARDDTRDTTVFVGAGLLGALLAALLLFSGLINSMRAPLSRLVAGAKQLADGELETRVEVGGPVEINTLGHAFNEMADALERDMREREQIEQMKDDFVLTVSHELRTPVTVVKGFAEMLNAQKRNLTPQQKEAATVIHDSAGQLQNMVHDLLDLARSDAGKLRIEPEQVSSRTLTRKAGQQMGPTFAEKNQKLVVRTETGLPKVVADPGRITQVLTNLLGNAQKYTPDGSQVRLAARRVNGAVEFSVSDNGPGLSAEALEHVFDRFWRAESGETRAVGGTGLGLAIAKSLVDLHGGEIWVESEPGNGATFLFTIPASQKSPRRGSS